jgi:hypothetical protein
LPSRWREKWPHDQKIGWDPRIWLQSKPMPKPVVNAKILAGQLRATIQTYPYYLWAWSLQQKTHEFVYLSSQLCLLGSNSVLSLLLDKHDTNKKIENRRKTFPFFERNSLLYYITRKLNMKWKPTYFKRSKKKKK